jgi:hypothetical protein
MTDKPIYHLSPAIAGRPLTARQIAERAQAKAAARAGLATVAPAPTVHSSGVTLSDGRGHTHDLATGFRSHAKQHVGTATATIVDVMTDDTIAPATRLAAAKLILAYGIGLPIRTSINASARDIAAMQQTRQIEIDDDRLAQLERAASGEPAE